MFDGPFFGIQIKVILHCVSKQWNFAHHLVAAISFVVDDAKITVLVVIIYTKPWYMILFLLLIRLSQFIDVCLCVTVILSLKKHICKVSFVRTSNKISTTIFLSKYYIYSQGFPVHGFFMKGLSVLQCWYSIEHGTGPTTYRTKYVPWCPCPSQNMKSVDFKIINI